MNELCLNIKYRIAVIFLKMYIFAFRESKPKNEPKAHV